MPTFVPLGGDLAGNLVAGLIGNNIVDAFVVADANTQTGKLLRYLIGPAFEEFKGLADMDAVAASATAMDAVAASATAMDAVAASATAMDAVAASATAMDAVAASATARNAIRNSSTAFNIVAGSNMAIGKFVAGEAGLNPADYADMDAVAASATAMDAVAASATAMNAICESQVASVAIYSAIQSLRSTLVSTLDAATNLFTKATVAVGDGAGIFDHGPGTATIYIPTACYDDGDTTYTAYYGADTSKAVVSVWQHSGTVAVTSGVSLRGVRLAGSGGSVGNMTFNVYTAV